MDGNDSIICSWCDIPDRSDMVCQFNANGGPSSGPSDGSSGSIVVMPVGGYMGEGLLPIPERLAKKTVALEFVEMRDLMPETWLKEEEESARNTLSLPRRRTAPVTNILQWLQCYDGMVGVLSQKFLQMVPELMAYQVTIIKCSRDFEGLAYEFQVWS